MITAFSQKWRFFVQNHTHPGRQNSNFYSTSQNIKNVKKTSNIDSFKRKFHDFEEESHNKTKL